jgi:hypothetical protein
MSGDDDSKLPRFEVLNDSGNYPEWAIRMEAVLIRRGLLEVVVFEADEGITGDEEKAAKEAWKKKRTVKKMAEARAEIILRVDDSQLAHARDRDPMEIWEALAKVHTARGFATRLALRRRFSRLTKSGEETMSAWVGRVKKLSFKLEDIGVNISDEDRILALTNGLDNSYEPFIISLDSTSADQISLEYVVDRLLNEEVRRGNTTKEKENVGVMQGGTAYLAGTRGSANAGPYTCWRCGQPGHVQAFCKEIPASKGAAHIAYDVSQLQDLGAREIGRIY